jgi:hypothetical protein
MKITATSALDAYADLLIWQLETDPRD